ncbi:MAG: hypothetical protein GKR94_10310 [Gammaproteobacteria bacterium]|nr:hypothetical protein [Gammaproteobacteria bacterium]
MLTKLLFTGLVIAIGIFLQRLRNRKAAEPKVIRVVQTQPAQASAMPPWIRTGAYLFAALVAGSSALWYYSTWRENQQVVTIRVINTGSGDVATYQAHQGDIEGRSFTTTEGLQVRIADAERVEISQGY